MRELVLPLGRFYLCSHIKYSVVVWWIMMAAASRKVQPAARLHCSALNPSSAFSTFYHLLPLEEKRWAAQTRGTCSHQTRGRCARLGGISDGLASQSPCCDDLRSTQQRRRHSKRGGLAALKHYAAGMCGSVGGQDRSPVVNGGVDTDVHAVLSGERDAAAIGSSCSGDCSFSSFAQQEPDPLVERVRTALEERCGVRGGDQVLVLVSGGSDSVALLTALHEAGPMFTPPIHLEAAHFNHALRGQDSDADEAFVVNLAKTLGIKLHIRRWRPADDGSTGGARSGIQERARKWRRSEACDILKDMLSESGDRVLAGDGNGRRGFIATAHHRDDQTETVLLKALRGAHITKMQGMAWEADRFVRPMLEAHKFEVVNFLRQRRQEWREDGSNQVAKYMRNRVRLQLVPLLQELAGGAGALDTRFAELSRQSKLAREMVQSDAERWETQHYTSTGPDRDSSEESEYSMEAAAPRTGRRLDLFPLVPFLSVRVDEDGNEANERPLPELVREELLHRFVTANTDGAVLPYAQLLLLMRQVKGGGNKWALSLEGGFVLRRIGDFLQVQRQAGPQSRSPILDDHIAAQGVHNHEMPMQDDKASEHSQQESTTHPWKVEFYPGDANLVEGAEGAGKGGSGKEEIVLYNVSTGTKLHVRRRRDGDRFRPVWRDRPTKVKDFLRGQGVPLHRRDEVALICDQDEKVIAVYPSFPGAGYHEDNTGYPPVRLKVCGASLCCPRPTRDAEARQRAGGVDANNKEACS